MGHDTSTLERLAAIVDPAGDLGPEDRRRLTDAVLARFERSCQPVSGGCHLWTGSLAADGYGQISVNGRLWLARRLAYEMWTGRIGAHERVFSTGEVRACVNYRHRETRPVAMPTLPEDRFTGPWAQTEAGA